jgi:hypothetical protein
MENNISDLIGILDTTGAAKFKAAKTLRMMAEQDPAALYPHFEVFVKLMDSPNNIIKWTAIDIIGFLTAADKPRKFEVLFEKYYAKMEEGSLITAAHVVEISPEIIKNKPELEAKITARLLAADRVPLPTEECRDILCGKVIVAFSKYAGKSGSKAEMVKFAQKVAGRSPLRPATRKKAEGFLKK